MSAILVNYRNIPSQLVNYKKSMVSQKETKETCYCRDFAGTHIEKH